MPFRQLQNISQSSILISEQTAARKSYLEAGSTAATAAAPPVAATLTIAQQEVHQMQQDFMHDINGTTFPNLFEETMQAAQHADITMATEQQQVFKVPAVPPPPPMITITEPPAEPIVLPDQGGTRMVKTISAEINKLAELQTKKYEKAAAPKRRRLLIDQQTELNDTEMRGRMLISNQTTILHETVDSGKEEEEEAYFLPRDEILKAKYDYFKRDLTRVPSSQMARRTYVEFDSLDLAQNIYCRLASRNMVTSREPDSRFSYLTELHLAAGEKRVLLPEQATPKRVPRRGAQPETTLPGVEVRGIKNTIFIRFHWHLP